jgi:hypothetical protein
MCSSGRDWLVRVVLTGLTEVERVSAKLGAQVVAVTDLHQSMSLLKHNPSTNFGKPLEPAAGLSRTGSVDSPSVHYQASPMPMPRQSAMNEL